MINFVKKTSMRTLYIILFTIIPATFFSGYIYTNSEILKKIGLSDEEAKNSIWNSLNDGLLVLTVNQTMKQIKETEKEKIINQLGQYIKTYTKSEEFKQKYLEARNLRKPSPPEKPMTRSDMIQNQKAEIEKSILAAEESKKSLPKEQQEQINETIKLLQLQLKSFEDSESAIPTIQDSIMNAIYTKSLADYNLILIEWEKENPSTPDALIRKRLEEFLKISEDIDFNAKLIKGPYQKMLFENPEYEAKSGQWKMCFRAGKNTITYSRKFANQWLKELKAKEDN